MSTEPKRNGKVNPPSQIFLKFNKQIELFVLIPKKLFFLKFGAGFVRLWTTQNDYFWGSMKRKE